MTAKINWHPFRSGPCDYPRRLWRIGDTYGRCSIRRDATHGLDVMYADWIVLKLKDAGNGKVELVVKPNRLFAVFGLPEGDPYKPMSWRGILRAAQAHLGFKRCAILDAVRRGDAP